jgi:Vault protein inter-alpha-trypsin domain/von Willebrand factor type A domain
MIRGNRSVLVLALALVSCSRAGIQRPLGVPPVAVGERRPLKMGFAGPGSLEVRGEVEGNKAKTRLALESLSITARTAGDMAETTVEHVFRSDADERLEGTFRFPLPSGAIVIGLAMEIDGALRDGELARRDEARNAYEKTVDQMLDPALLEWESGQTFTLRVFPIEPKTTKRIVVTLLVPLWRGEDGLYFAYRPPSLDGAPVATRVTVDGRPIVGPVTAPTGELLAKVGGTPPPAFVEHTAEGDYLVADVVPNFGAARPSGATETRRPQALIVLCDRSRSMLEARTLQRQVLSMLLERLDVRDRFAILTGDVQAHRLPGGLRQPTAADRAAAGAFVDGAEPDGASDLGGLVEAAARIGEEARAAQLEPALVYLGDATATWGETRATRLAQRAQDGLGGAPLHVVVLGKSSDDGTARALASATHGRLLRPKSEQDARGVADAVVVARTARRIDDLKVLAPAAFDLAQSPASVLYEGDDLQLAMFVAKDDDAPRQITLLGTLDGKPYEQSLALGSAAPTRDIGKRWAEARIEALQGDGEVHKEEVIAASLAHGVMSRYTSFLVLESEEAYARMKIERKAKAADANETRVSGRDLDNAPDRPASVTPDHLQPGDPEVRIRAPADAKRVVVVLPFGETKNASFEDDDRGGSWVVRFLVDVRTPDGTYDIVVRITHADGRVEMLRVPYVVDTQRPNVDVSVRTLAAGRYEIHAKERASDASTDAKRVEVLAPDGQLLSLVPVRLGQFVGTWSPRSLPGPHEKLRVVVVDRALNERVTDVELP